MSVAVCSVLMIQVQFDLEKSYADGQQIISDVENIVKDTWRRLREDHVYHKYGESLVPVQRQHVAGQSAQVRPSLFTESNSFFVPSADDTSSRPKLQTSPQSLTSRSRGSRTTTP